MHRSLLDQVYPGEILTTLNEMLGIIGMTILEKSIVDYEMLCIQNNICDSCVRLRLIQFGLWNIGPISIYQMENVYVLDKVFNWEKKRV